MSLLITIMIGVGILLVYSAIKNESPKAVVEKALKKGN